jgi:CBS domain-containing protein
MKIRDVMTVRVLSVSPQTPVREVVRLMLENRISGVPVVDAAGHVIGVVSESDFVRRPEIDTAGPGSPWLRLFTSAEDQARDFIRTHGRIAADVMSSPAITAPPDAPLGRVAHLMNANGIKRVPVAEDGRLVGIVTRADLLRAVFEHPALVETRPDAEIRAAIQGILDTEDWVAGAVVTVTVEGGNVALRGAVDTEAQREALLLAVRNVPGVRSVEAGLAHSLAG